MGAPKRTESMQRAAARRVEEHARRVSGEMPLRQRNNAAGRDLISQSDSFARRDPSCIETTGGDHNE